jgi:hypothetical protein
LYFSWEKNSGRGFQFPGAEDGESRTIPIREVLHPNKITVSFGAENYTVLAAAQPGVWYAVAPNTAPGFMDILHGALLHYGDTIAVSDVSERDFKDVTRARSIQVDFPFPMPFSEFCTEFDLKYNLSADSIGTFTCIAYSESSPNSLFIGNKQESRYHRLALDADQLYFKDLISSIETKRYASFYPLRTFSGVENEVMIPLDMETTMRALPYEHDPDVGNPQEAERIAEMAKQFFGTRFDFTRKITEGNGTTVYMYGYGEKVLAINPDGRFQYNEAESDTGGTATFFGALRLALDFISRHSDGDARNVTPGEIYLKKVSYNPEGKRSYRFSFGIKAGEYEIHYEGAEPLVVNVTGQQVTYFVRDMIDCDTKPDNEERARQSYPPFDLLAENFQSVYETLLREAVMEVPKEAEQASAGPMDEVVFEAIAERVRNVSVGLLRQAESGEYSKWLLPVWVFTIEDIDFYFDFYGSELIGYTK